MMVVEPVAYYFESDCLIDTGKCFSRIACVNLQPQSQEQKNQCEAELGWAGGSCLALARMGTGT